MDQLAQLLSLPAEASNLAIPSLLLNLLLGAALGGLLRAQYVRFSASLANRELFARNVIPIILAVTLIIMVVKASLALSLGLVGALSIVRFRTPIKDPEELVYLFIAIAIGLGLGAEQSVATAASIGLILAILTALSWKHGEACWAFALRAVTARSSRDDRKRELHRRSTDFAERQSGWRCRPCGCREVCPSSIYSVDNT